MTIFLSPVVSSYFPLLMYHKEQELIDLTLLSYFFFFGAGSQASSFTCKVHIIPSYGFNLKKYILLDSVLSTHVAAQQLSVPPDSRESDGLS